MNQVLPKEGYTEYYSQNLIFQKQQQQQQQSEWFNSMQNTSKVKRRMKQIQQQVIAIFLALFFLISIHFGSKGLRIFELLYSEVLFFIIIKNLQIRSWKFFDTHLIIDIFTLNS